VFGERARIRVIRSAIFDPLSRGIGVHTTTKAQMRAGTFRGDASKFTIKNAADCFLISAANA
jgi:hypothetical protein